MSDTKALIAEARAGADRAWEIGHDSTSRIVRRLADALEEAIAENVRLPALLDGYTRDYPIQCNARAKAEAALEAAMLERAVVEAQALEQAADDLEAGDWARRWLRARAVEIREGRQ